MHLWYQKLEEVRGSESAAGRTWVIGTTVFGVEQLGDCNYLHKCQQLEPCLRPQGLCACSASSWSKWEYQHQLELEGLCAHMISAMETTAFISSPNLVRVGVDQMASRWSQVHAEGPCCYRRGTSECGACVTDNWKILCAFARDHHAGPESEWDTSWASKCSWDEGRGCCQRENADAWGICKCVWVDPKSKSICVNLQPDWLKKRTWVHVVMCYISPGNWCTSNTHRCC